MLAVVFWSHSSAGCRLWRLVLLSVEGLSIHSCPAYRHLCRVIYSSPGPSPCHWLMPPSLPALCASRLSSLLEGYFSQTGTHGPWAALCFQCCFPPPCLFFVSLAFLSLLTCTLIRPKCETYTDIKRLHSWNMWYLMCLRWRRYGFVSW